MHRFKRFNWKRRYHEKLRFRWCLFECINPYNSDLIRNKFKSSHLNERLFYKVKRQNHINALTMVFTLKTYTVYCIFITHSRVHCSSDTNRSMGFCTKLMAHLIMHDFASSISAKESTQRRLPVNKRREFVSVMLRYYQHFLLASTQHKTLSSDLSHQTTRQRELNYGFPNFDALYVADFCFIPF